MFLRIGSKRFLFSYADVYNESAKVIFAVAGISMWSLQTVPRMGALGCVLHSEIELWAILSKYNTALFDCKKGALLGVGDFERISEPLLWHVAELDTH